MANTVDITNASDTVLDAFLALKTGDASFDFDALTSRDLLALKAMGCKGLDGWLALTPAPTSGRSSGRDYEGAILARQEAEYVG